MSRRFRRDLPAYIRMFKSLGGFFGVLALFITILTTIMESI